MSKPMLLCICLIAMIFFAANGDKKEKEPDKLCSNVTDYNTNDWYKDARKVEALLLHDRYIDYNTSFDLSEYMNDEVYAQHAAKLPFKSRLTEILFHFTALDGQNFSARIYFGDATQWTLGPMVTSSNIDSIDLPKDRDDVRDVFFKNTFRPEDKMGYQEAIVIYKDGQSFNSNCVDFVKSRRITHLYIRANPATTVLKRISLVGWSKD